MPEIPPLDDSVLAGVHPAPEADRGARLAAAVFIPLLVLFAAVVLVFYVLFSASVVDGESMLPTLRPADRLLVSSSYRVPERGDVVVARVIGQDGTPEEVVKRVIAVPGDRVEIKDDLAFVNGRPETQGSIVRAPGLGVNVAEQKLSPGDVYLLGDNRPVSYDSRYLGPVPISNIEGKAVFIFAPIDRLRLVP